MTNSQDAIAFFIQHTKYQSHEISSCTLMCEGFTNLSYQILTSDKQLYQVKFTRFKQPTMINEVSIYQQYLPQKLIYYDHAGNLIKKWTVGEHFNLDDDLKQKLTLFFTEIEKFHKITPMEHVKVFDYFIYTDVLQQSPAMYTKYCGILKHYADHPLIVSHNDTNFKNTIMYESEQQLKLHLIDFEWVTLNYAWMDYINLFCEEEIYSTEVLNHLIFQLPEFKSLEHIYELMFVRWFFAYGWATKELQRLPKMQTYYAKCIKNLEILKTKLSF